MKDPGIKQVIDEITESDGKIVVTTTISLDRNALEQRSGTTDLPLGFLDRRSARRSSHDSGIALTQIGPKTYLGLVDGRTRAHPLRIGDTLFIFVPRQHSLTGLAELVAELVRQMPFETVWHREGEALDTERIREVLAESGHFSS